MSEAKIIPPIITSEDAEQLNTKLQNELAAHLFLFCHYRPIPENPQSKYARFVPDILNLYIFSIDACFYLKNFNEILNKYEIFKGGNIPSALYTPAQRIYNIVREIAQLRTAIAHNGTSESGDFYQNWIKGVLYNKYPASRLDDFEKLENKLFGMRDNLIKDINNVIVAIGKLDKEKNQIVDAWERKTIEVFSRKHNGIYERQLRNAYRDKTSNDKPKWSDLENWIEDSIGYRFQLQIDELTKQITTTENEIRKHKKFLKQIEAILVSSGDGDKQKWIQHKNCAQKTIDELIKQKDETKKLQDEQQEKLNKQLNQVDDYKQKGKTITKFFYDHLEEQLSQTLKELKEEKDPNFTFFPEYFIREDIERNFPPLY